ncbi:MAG: exosortase system-associated protein, TIGR04073 family [Candidatus Omnitrophica bacterium]|nr:exosortase system-associated protein, TIGR04073 family [Candidatus Omnitrophota bacterium]
MSKFGIALVAVSLLMLLMSPTSFAGEKCGECFNKLGNGLVNLLTGWVEIPKQIIATYDDTKNVAETAIVGTLKGFIHAIGRTSAGAVDTVFFFIPPYDQPLVEPLYHPFDSSKSSEIKGESK